jgi:hypothetical protein
MSNIHDPNADHFFGGPDVGFSDEPNETRTQNTMVPWDDSFPYEVVHFANPEHRLSVVWYGLESTMYGSVPVVACDDSGGWYAGESDVENGVPTLFAVNGYADQETALSYIRNRNKVWTL